MLVKLLKRCPRAVLIKQNSSSPGFSLFRALLQVHGGTSGIGYGIHMGLKLQQKKQCSEIYLGKQWDHSTFPLRKPWTFYMIWLSTELLTIKFKGIWNPKGWKWKYFFCLVKARGHQQSDFISSSRIHLGAVMCR